MHGWRCWCRTRRHSLAPSQVLTDYVATRWYRAPEILLGSTQYTKGVDMWAVGCILGEMLAGKPIFPGTSTMNQLDLILEVTGRPAPADIEAISSAYATTMLESLPPSRPRSLSEMLPSATPEALDLMRQCLQFNPHKRISAEEALRHPYVSQFHNADDEPAATTPVRIKIDDNTKCVRPSARPVPPSARGCRPLPPSACPALPSARPVPPSARVCHPAMRRCAPAPLAHMLAAAGTPLRTIATDCTGTLRARRRRLAAARIAERAAACRTRSLPQAQSAAHACVLWTVPLVSPPTPCC